MDKSKWTEYEKYLVLAGVNKNMQYTYKGFVEYKKVLLALKKIESSKNNNVFEFDNNIYNHKISSSEATKVLEDLSNFKYNDKIQLIANQLGRRI